MDINFTFTLIILLLNNLICFRDWFILVTFCMMALGMVTTCTYMVYFVIRVGRNEALKAKESPGKIGVRFHYNHVKHSTACNERAEPIQT